MGMAGCVQVVYWLGVFSVLLCFTESYLPDETECPHTVNHHIFAPQYWVVPGTPHRAWRTLPWKLFSISPSTIPNAGMGVFTNTFIAKHTWLGEYEGEFLNLEQAEEAEDLAQAWVIYTDDEVSHYVDAGDVRMSNWLRFIKNPVHSSKENIQMHTCFGRVYYRTTMDMSPGTEMFVYYGDDYIEDNLGLNATEYRMKIDHVISHTISKCVQ